MLEEALIDIVEKGGLHTILVRKVDKLAKFTRFMDALKRRIIGNTSFIMPIAAFGRKHLDTILEEVFFVNELEKQLYSNGR